MSPSLSCPQRVVVESSLSRLELRSYRPCVRLQIWFASEEFGHDRPSLVAKELQLRRRSIVRMNPVSNERSRNVKDLVPRGEPQPHAQVVNNHKGLVNPADPFKGLASDQSRLEQRKEPETCHILEDVAASKWRRVAELATDLPARVDHPSIPERSRRLRTRGVEGGGQASDHSRLEDIVGIQKGDVRTLPLGQGRIERRAPPPIRPGLELDVHFRRASLEIITDRPDGAIGGAVVDHNELEVVVVL